MVQPPFLQQITPTFPPKINGLADSAVLIAQTLARQFEIQTRFIVGDPRWVGPREHLGFPVTKVRSRSAPTLQNLLHNLPTVLHYEGYGYAQRGYPRWLKGGLKQWRGQFPQAPLLTLFHEVYPYHAKPPWTSSFWLSPLQRRLVGQLIRLSRAVITSKESYAQLLAEIEPTAAEKTIALPIISTIGEPETPPSPLRERPRRLIVFGHPNSRRLVYGRDRPLLLQACQELGIVAIDDVGVSTELSELSGQLALPVVEHGVIAAAAVQQLMAGAIAGFTSFIPPDYLAKSSVYAAFCAYGLIPIMGQGAQQMMDGLKTQTHYWVVNPDAALNLALGSQIAQNATNWYRQHDLQTYTQTLLSALIG
ncbi:MAG: glycosyltransferase family 1 protein [Cyanobacteria bacterium P01_G01_bin.54]